MRIDFGKYAGKTLDEIAAVEPGYLHTMIRDETYPAPLRAEAARILEIRGELGAGAAQAGWPAWLWSVVGGLVVLVAVVVTQHLAPSAPPSPPVLAPSPVALLVSPQAPAPPDPGSRAAVESDPTPTPQPQTAPATVAPPTVTRVDVTASRLPCGSRTRGAIRAEQTSDHFDEAQTVEFEVVRAYNSGRAVFLNSHDPFQGYFAVVIFPERWQDFPQPPEKYFAGKCIAVGGTIERYRGAPEIVLDAAEDIRIVE